jgi:regulator of sigma D
MLLNQIIFIILGAIVIYYIYYTNQKIVQYFQNSTSKQIDELGQYYYDNVVEDIVSTNKFLKEYAQMYPLNKDSTAENGSFFETLNQKLALVNSMKILNHINSNTKKAMNLYEVCYKNGNPCNDHCVQLNSDFCKIYKYNNSQEN